jgi:hypothetical protein
VDVVASGAQASDWAISARGGRLIDSAQATSLVQSHTAATGVLTSTARARDMLLARQDDAVVDSATVSDSASGSARVQGALGDEAAASDLLVDAVSLGVAVIDQGRADSFVEGSAHAVDVLGDSGFAADQVEDGYALPSVWTCEAATFGMSRLLPGGVRDLAVVDGLLCACSPDGLVVFDAPAAAPRIQTGLTDLGSPVMKRSTFAHVGYTGDPVTLAVGNTGSGQEETYQYQLPARQASAATASRQRLGRGARSRYWRITLTGTAFQLHDVALEIELTSRKV